MSIAILPATTTTVKPTVPPDMQHAIDYLDGKDMYRRGARRTVCANDAQREGWDDGYAEGADSYLRAMYMADADGDRVDWGDVYEVAGLTVNAYGDLVY